MFRGCAGGMPEERIAVCSGYVLVVPVAIPFPGTAEYIGGPRKQGAYLRRRGRRAEEKRQKAAGGRGPVCGRGLRSRGCSGE